MIMLVKAIELTLFPAVMAFAASSDLFTMTIANRVSIILVAGFALLAALTGMDASDLLSHVGAAAAVLAVVFVFFAFGWIGGGDAKLAAATALWFGFAHLVDYLFYASLIGGALTLFIEVEGIEQILAAVQKSGAKITMPLKDQFYGMREFAFEDPEGWELTVAERIQK